MDFVRVPVVLLTATLLCGGPVLATAQGVPGVDKNKCLAGKTKCVSKKLAGLLKCRESCQKTPLKCGPAQTICEEKVMAKFDGGADPAKGCFAKLEAKEKPSKPESICTTTGDTASMEAEVDAVAAELLARLEGTPPTCGDGVVNVVGEQCDGTDLSGTTCGSLGAGSGTLACSGSCTLDATGCFDCAALGGAEAGGSCWFLSPAGSSCSAACSAAGLSYDDATRTYAGSDGTNSQCDEVLTALTFVGGLPSSDSSCVVGVGCSTLINPFPTPPDAVRCTSPATDAGSSAPAVVRACACL